MCDDIPLHFLSELCRLIIGIVEAYSELPRRLQKSPAREVHLSSSSTTSVYATPYGPSQRASLETATEAESATATSPLYEEPVNFIQRLSLQQQEPPPIVSGWSPEHYPPNHNQNPSCQQRHSLSSHLDLFAHAESLMSLKGEAGGGDAYMLLATIFVRLPSSTPHSTPHGDVVPYGALPPEATRRDATGVSGPMLVTHALCQRLSTPPRWRFTLSLEEISDIRKDVIFEGGEVTQIDVLRGLVLTLPPVALTPRNHAVVTCWRERVVDTAVSRPQ
ncbi:unnamed protein product [Taenia asiatica]|uniref:Uncharacterized protein n=1 Tax=Taenia asiatica TaxID=60517 RepID=A0A0R3W939_TAEAS|nr:unnamed protein product [Taenia asiatica]